MIALFSVGHYYKYRSYNNANDCLLFADKLSRTRGTGFYPMTLVRRRFPVIKGTKGCIVLCGSSVKACNLIDLKYCRPSKLFLFLLLLQCCRSGLATIETLP